MEWDPHNLFCRVLNQLHADLRRRSWLYDAWHNFPWHPHVHWAILIAYVVGMVSGVLTVTTGQLYRDAGAQEAPSATFGPSGSVVGTAIGKNQTLASFFPKTALDSGATVTLTFPIGTKLASSEITTSDFTISQLAPTGDKACKAGKDSNTDSIIVDEGTRTIAVGIKGSSLSHGNCGGKEGLGQTEIKLSSKASGTEITLPTVATNSATFSVSTSKGDLAQLANVSFVAGPATKLGFAHEPSLDATAGETFSEQPQARVLDDYGNVVESYSGEINLEAIQAEEPTRPGRGKLSAKKIPLAVEKGYAKFSALVYDQPEKIVLKASSGALAAAQSKAIIVKAKASSAKSSAAEQTVTPGATTAVAAPTAPSAVGGSNTAASEVLNQGAVSSSPALSVPPAAAPQPTQQVTIRVTDASGRPLEGVKVTIFSTPKTAVTDSGGFAVFSDVEAGEHTIVIEAPSGTTQEKLLVSAATPALVTVVASQERVSSPSESQPSAEQNQTLQSQTEQSDPMHDLLIAFIVLGLIVALPIVVIRVQDR